jgi:hypothetical protein
MSPWTNVTIAAMPDTPGTNTSERKPRGARFGGDRYLALLAIVLLGYALMGKGFAYLGVSPLYMGEIALFAGIVVFLRIGVFVGVLATLPTLLLAALMFWVLARTLPFFGLYGFDAVRDSVVVIYGGFAFIVIGLLLEDARRINTVLRYYGVMLTLFPAIPVGFWLTRFWLDYIPRLYGPVPIVEIGASAVGTHLAGAMVFVLIGYRKVSLLWVIVWFITLALIGSTNRGATLAAIVPVAIAMLVLGRYRLMLTGMVAVVGVLAVLIAIEENVTQYNEYNDPRKVTARSISAHQIVENAKSTVLESSQQNEGTKQWRLNWWQIIINDTLYGPSFWTGRGFGINLGDADGFGGSDLKNPSPPTRSPHNAHMTLLARAGVPGVVLWSMTLISWIGMQLNAMLSARARGHERWAELFLFILCYAVSILINATFDVTLEGPMQGIWFWCLFGFGVGSAMIYRAQYADAIGATVR